jgi:esterase/lipase
MKHCKAPTLVMGGDSEPELKLEETQSVFDHCASANKRICIFKGAHHENFLKRYEEQYKTTLRSFLDDVAASWTAAEKKAA